MDKENENIKCDNCNDFFPKNELDNHQLYCVYNLNQNEFENMIPCEICKHLINFNEFESHMNTCGYHTNPLSRFNNIFRNLLETTTQQNNINLNFIPIQTSNYINTENGPIENETIENVNEPIENVNEPIENETIENNEMEDDDTDDDMPALINQEQNNQINNSNIENENNQQNLNTNSIQYINELLNVNINALGNNMDTVRTILNSNSNNDYESLIELNNNNVKRGIKDLKNVGNIIDNITNKDCPICSQNDFDTIIKTNCNHSFCYSCLEEWLKENVKCPICMKEFKE